MIKKALLERNSLSGICRIFNISLYWLLSFIGRLYKELPDNLNIDFTGILKSVAKYDIVICEADELWSFVGNKENKKWVWLLIDRNSRQILAFHVGGRTKRDALKLWINVPEILREHCFVYTDFLESYAAVIPHDKHKSVGKETGETAHIERLNCTFRQRISRLVRKSLSFSKKVLNHIGAIKHFICDYNKNLASGTA